MNDSKLHGFSELPLTFQKAEKREVTPATHENLFVEVAIFESSVISVIPFSPSKPISKIIPW